MSLRLFPLIMSLPVNTSHYGLEDTPPNRVLICMMEKLDTLMKESANERKESKAWRLAISSKVNSLEEELQKIKDSYSTLHDRLRMVESACNSVNPATDARLKKIEGNLRSAATNPPDKHCLDQVLKKLDNHEKELKKCNVIIRGHIFPNKNLAVNVQDFLRTRFTSFKGKVLEAKTLKKDGMISVKLDSLESKKELFDLKNASKVTGLYIQNDLSTLEQEADFHVRQYAKKKRSKGHVVIVSDQIANLGGNYFYWDHEEKIIKKFTSIRSKKPKPISTPASDEFFSPRKKG